MQKDWLNFDKKSLRLSRAGGMIKEKMYEVKGVKGVKTTALLDRL